jgi:single-stranded DNA-binding protein
MPAGAISQLMGFVYNSDFKCEGQYPLLKFRLGVSRYDFSSKKTVMDFFTLTAFGKSAQSINSSISSGANYICCFCDVKVSKYLSKSGTPVEHVEFIVKDFRTFSVQKSSQQEQHNSQELSSPQDFPNTSALPSSQEQSFPSQPDTGADSTMPDFHNPSDSQSTQFSFFPNSTASSPPPF